MADQTNEPKAKIGDLEFSKEEFLDAFAGDEPGVDQGEEPTVWAAITYEEGTGGPLQQAGGILVDDPDGVTILDPETGTATIIGDRFIIRIDIIQVEADDEVEMEDDE